jgi:hypothetical protein
LITANRSAVGGAALTWTVSPSLTGDTGTGTPVGTQLRWTGPTGLTNATQYTFTVTTVAGAVNSSASVVTNAITPACS